MSNFKEFIDSPNELLPLLMVADTDDLDVLVDYITDKGDGRIALDADTCRRLVACKNAGVYNESDRKLICNELLEFGGNTFANAYRRVKSTTWFGVLEYLLPDVSPQIEYSEIVRDVAKSLKADFGENDDNLAVENAIMVKVLKRAFEKMTPDQRDEVLKALGVSSLSMIGPGLSSAAIVAGRLGGFQTYKLAVIVANAIAKAILGRGLSGIGNRLLTKILKVAMGPIGMAITGIWTLADLASPASRVTVPCVIQIAYMRQKALRAATIKECQTCQSGNALTAKFCTECGSLLAT